MSNSYLDSLRLTDKELEVLKTELQDYLDSDLSEEENRFAMEHCSRSDFELVIGFYSGFKTALYISQMYPELLKEKEDEKKE